ncbi:MAG TPA: TolC family protein [Verrucomicrobiae bacterium]|nr:TolC family protein [Verrucomicrobiae bacterium]
MPRPPVLLHAALLVPLLCLLAESSPGFAETTNAPMLTLQDAETEALRNHPRISAADLRALAAKQTVTEARSAYYPTLSGNVTAASTDGRDNTRLAAGGLNNPVIFERAALGLVLTQTITDFGRSVDLSESAKFRALAESDNAAATRLQLLWQVDLGYFDVLQAQSLLEVARQTVDTRQVLFEQVSALASNKLKSDLDVSFAQVGFEEARLLLARTENDLRAAFTRLATLLGSREDRRFTLVEEPLATNSPPDVAPLVFDALNRRPEILEAKHQRDAAQRLAGAERALHYPTIAAVASTGLIPVHDSHLPDQYAAAGVNFSLPIFNGFLYTARSKEAELRARSAEENLRDWENRVIRDTRLAWLDLGNAIERWKIATRLQDAAEQAYALADAKYKAGASSMVELSQAQLNVTAARIAAAASRYELLAKRAGLDYQLGARSSK